MSPLDASFVHMERREAPQHGSVLIILQPPDDARPDYMRRLYHDMREHPVTAAKFNRVLSAGLVDRVVPAWTVLAPEQIDIDYHFRHSALPAPGGELELGLLISRLVTHALDLDRPPWELHLIEGLEAGRFAVYLKMHHALVDGISAMLMVRSWLSADPSHNGPVVPPWANARDDREPSKTKLAQASAARAALARLKEAATGPVTGIARVGGALAASAVAATGRGDGLVAPYTAPRSIFNRPITQRRRVSTQRLELARVKRIAKQTGGTVNDAIAVVLGTALRRYLSELDELPDRALVAGVLTSLHAVAGGAAPGSGNLISVLFADLATESDDIAGRIRRVHASTSAGKAHLLGLGSDAMAYSAVMLAPMVTSMIAGQGHRLPPIQNIGLSNVPGSDVPLYWDGAEVEALHATTILYHGQAAVMTVASWNGMLNFTLTACPDAVPHSQRIAVYLKDALAEVESALGLKPAEARSG